MDLKWWTVRAWQHSSKNSGRKRKRRLSDAGYLHICGRRVGAPSRWCVLVYFGVRCWWARCVFTPTSPRHRLLTVSASQYSSRRFGALNEDETRDMHDYITNITLSKGSGEYCICQSLSSVLRIISNGFQRIYWLLVPMHACLWLTGSRH